jgi:hypothetical protein
MTTIHRDWIEFLNALRSENTKFLLIGAHALAYRAEGRLTEYFDIFVEATLLNAGRVQRALVSFGFADFRPQRVLKTYSVLEQLPSSLRQRTCLPGLIGNDDCAS